MDEPKLEWGLTWAPPDDTPAAWGARGIVEERGFSLLGDRQCFIGDDEARKRLRALLNGPGHGDGALAKAQDQARALQDEGKLWKHPPYRDPETLDPIDWSKEIKERPDVKTTPILYEDDAICVQGSTNGSYGHIYLAAWLKPETT